MWFQLESCFSRESSVAGYKAQLRGLGCFTPKWPKDTDFKSYKQTNRQKEDV